MPRCRAWRSNRRLRLDFLHRARCTYHVLQRLRASIEKAHGWTELACLGINAALAAWATIAIGGALLVATSQGHPDLDDIRRVAWIAVPLGSLVLASAAWAIVNPSHRRHALRLHAACALVSAVWLIVWALGLALQGVSSRETGATVWTPGMLTCWVAYSSVSFARFVWPGTSPPSRTSLAASSWIAIAAALIDIGVLLRILA
jgi:hypothetical protein